ncbi:ATP-binding protein [Ihubacter massiliensis]|uniref:ATP-binding protein n=1 Tax=Hominibacterium faecale TaxID=2839743 RepID=A0A9J6QSG8_9FIRM|nr:MULTISPECIES: ATP-binding protein [Eubacteriales Family XIII. Incertae Sedis]MCO7123973.1 ATP-binding protein [Ihubacter massiliensis]MCU7378965.1 ATP-binding protein [Hominibacterium faecale]
MANIESIKQKILQLDAGSFQNLCDSYLYKIGYPNIVSLGGEAGTRKTTLGTPDTYFIASNGKYVFVEYTTQKTSLFAKIKDDLEKCLDTSKTGVPHDKISEIIYCHTSSNLTPRQDSEIKALCEDIGIKLTVIGIDKLAVDIYLFHHNLSRDFLGISISTGQIQSYDDFINSYNSNRMAARIDTQFLFREKEFKDIGDAYLKVDVVILNGSAGTGKTRLALHYVKNHPDANNEEVYCIHSNALPIYEDLKLFIDRPGNYFLFIDDANQLSGLQHIIRYVSMKPQGYNVKILITVRDYALQKVIKEVREITSYEIININVFTDEEIKKLLETSLGILNQNYHERITRIAEGNARIAILAGKVACNSNRLDSINDVSQLYEDYYGSYLEDNRLLVNKNTCITAGIVAFLEAIHLEHIDAFLPILQEKGLNRDGFIENVRILHDQEILDIYNDKAVRFSEQCLSNYLLKYVFFDKKLLSLSEMMKACFKSYKERTISSINTLLNIFMNETLFNFVEKEIKILWNELSKEKSPVFFEFVKVFFRINPTETLLILKHKIELEEDVNCEWCDIDTEKGKNYQNVTNDIIEILGGFADTDDLPTACDLFFQYYLKRPDLYMEFYHAVNLYFGINKDSAGYGFCTQIIFFEKIKEYSDNWKQEFVTTLFLEIAEEFLKLHFLPAEGGRKNTITIYQIPLVISDGVEKYRKLIWESLSSLCGIEKYKAKVTKILSSYGGTVENTSISVLQFDLKYITSILNSNFPPDELENCILANKIARVFNGMNHSCESLFAEYFEGEDIQLYHLLKGPDYKKEIDYKDCENQKRQTIEQYVSDCDLKMFKRLIDVCNDIPELDGHSSWKVGEGLRIAFDAIYLKKDCYVDAIKYYLEKDTPNNLNPDHLLDMFFSLLPDSEVYQIVVNGEYSQKNAWLYAYYHQLPPELITENHLYRIYDFLKDTSDGDITSSSMRDVDFLEKYNIIDEQALIKGCKIIVHKMEYSPFIVHIYFNLLFNIHHNTPQEVIKKFNCNLELLEQIYYAILSYDNYFDYNGQFLKEIYLVRPSMLDKYIDYLINKNKGSFRDHQERHRCFFDLDDFIEIYNKIFEQLLGNCRFPKMSVPYFLESLLLPTPNDQNLLGRQDKWIRQCIQLFSNDETKMYCLFSVISKFEIERKREYVLLFLKNNPLFENFERIPLTPTSWSWSGSAVPMYSAWIEYLKSLLPSFMGLKWIKHKKHIETQIGYLKREIESEQIDEILRG